MVAFGDGPTGVVPARDVFEFDFEDGALEAVEAGVPSEFVVVVAAAHSVLAKHAGAFGDVVVTGGDDAGVSGGAEVLGGVEAEGSGVAEGAGGFAVPFGTPGLSGVFEDIEASVAADFR